MHLTVDKSGKQCLLSGVCESVEKAEGIKHFVEDLKLSENVNIVHVTPESIKVVSP